MAGLAGHTLTTGGFTAALIAFAVTGAILVLLLFTSSLGVAIAQQQLADRLKSGAPTVKRWGGYTLILVGGWLLTLAAFADTFARIFPV